MVATRSRKLLCGNPIGLSVNRNRQAMPIAIVVQTAADCRGVERSEPKLKARNSVQRNIPPTSGAM